MAENEEKAPQQTYAEKIQEKQEESRQNAFKKAKSKLTVTISEEERKWAETTVSLIHNDQFKHYLELENLCLLEIMTTAYKTPPPGVFQSSSYGENMAFNAGMYEAYKRLKNRREQIWHSYLLMQKQEKENSDG